ncbi:DUF1828 domain-containing protein [Candidatus Saccharibacteria bacterium]|jgi:hypothetical protein|nr:DUF1828 domain-containing protein [Candidatus Saccharibacteria bacterium]
MSNFFTSDQMPIEPIHGVETPDSGFTRYSIHALIRPAIETAFLDMAPSDFDTTSTFGDLHIVAAFRGTVLQLLDRGLTLEDLDQKLDDLVTKTENDRINYFPNAFGVNENKGVFTVLASPDQLTRARIKGSTRGVDRIMGGQVSHNAKNFPLAKFLSKEEADTYFVKIARLYNLDMKPEGIPLAVFGGVQR